MDAKTLSKKKSTINKGKIKKTIKNVLCRPDPMFWPVISVDDVNILESYLSKYKVSIPHLKKAHWKEIKNIPKEERVKSPHIKKVDGLIFGISECLTNLQKCKCEAVIIDSNVIPHAIVQPTVEACIAADLPVVCMNDLRKTSFQYFGITTSCLGIKSDCLPDLKDEVIKMAKKHRPPLRKSVVLEAMEIEKITTEKLEHTSDCLKEESITKSPYLYRSSKKTRVFVPSEGVTAKVTKPFKGQDFIEFLDKPKNNIKSRAYMNMILKKVTNNPSRVKSK